MERSPEFTPLLEVGPYERPDPRCQFSQGCGELPETTVRYLLRREDGRIHQHGAAVDLCKAHAKEVRSSWEGT